MNASVASHRLFSKETAVVALVVVILFALLPYSHASALIPPGKVNAAAGKSYVSGTSAHVSYPDTNGSELTDGLYASDVYSDSAWQGHFGSGTFDFVIDLGELEPITDLSIRFLQDLVTGIHLPDQVTYSLSVDGETFVQAGIVVRPSTDGTRQIVAYGLTGLLNTTARYVKVAVEQGDSVWTFADEIEALQDEPAVIDVDAPTVPTGLAVTETTGSSVTLSWTASTDNVLVTGYYVYSGLTVVAFIAAPYVTIDGLSSGTSYTYTVKAKDKAGNLSAASAPITAETTSPPVFSGTFLQPDLGDSWNAAQWEEEFEYMQDVGIDQLVLQWTANSKFKTAVYPTSVTGYTQNTTQDLMELALETGESVGTDIYVGLNVNDDWFFKYANDPIWLDQEEDAAIAFADDLWTKYGSYSSFKGWYLSLEVENWNFPTATEWGRLANYYDNVIAHLKTLSPNKPVVISPYFNPAGGLNLAGWQDMWEYILDVAPIDVIALQDGVGAGHATTGQLADWFATTQSAIANARPTTELWADTETFNLDFQPMAIQTMVDDMDAVQPYVTNYLSFSFNHYISPQQGNSLYYDTYKDYYDNGTVETVAPTIPAGLSATALDSQTVQLLWTGSTDNIGVVGYQIYRNDEWVGRTYTSLSEFTDVQLDASTAYQYKIQAIDAAGNLSGFSATANVTTPAGASYPTNLALGKTYTASEPAHANYPDSGGQLTDGIRATSNFGDAEWQGYFAAAPLEFVVDLGAVSTIDEINAGFLQDKPLYIFLPKQVEYFVSSDNINFTSVGVVSKPAVGEATRTKDYKMTGLSGVTGRYVKARVTQLSSWIFMDEFEVRT